jgi:hypothetical protein
MVGPAQNYSLTSLLLSRIENLAGSIPQLLAFRAHPSHEAFQRKWQLPVYFQLRFKEVVGRVEGVLSSREATGAA